MLCGKRTVWREWGAGHPLIMLHGGFGSWTHYLRVIPLLAKHHRVLCPNMPGYGDSDDPAGGDVLHNLTAALSKGAMDIVGPQARVNVVGFSFGTVVAGAMCAELSKTQQYPRPHRLVLLAPAGIDIVTNMIDGLMSLEAGMGIEARHAVHRNNLARLMLSGPALVDEEAVIVQDINVAGARTRGRVYSQSNALLRALDERPVEAVAAAWGGRDGYVRGLEAYEDRLVNLYPGIVLRKIPEAGHWLQHEAASETVAFINGFLGAGPGQREIVS
jgi:2-hydroxy-6-oxonona-2,4-dienedioate hydrolase